MRDQLFTHSFVARFKLNQIKRQEKTLMFSVDNKLFSMFNHETIN